MGKTIKKEIVRNKHTQNRCVSCYHNLSKLKKLCKRKGLRTSFNKTYKMCQKHSKGSVTLIYNSYKMDRLQALIQNSIKNAIKNTFKDVQKKKYTRKVNKVQVEWIVEDTNIIDQLQSLDEKIDNLENKIVVGSAESKSYNLDHKENKEQHVSQAVPLHKEHNTGNQNDEDAKSDVTDIIVNIDNSESCIAEKNKFIPNEFDSLGMFNCTIDDEVSQKMNNVCSWKHYGFPYINELPQSQYDMPRINDDTIKKQLGWISPALSPILA